MAIRVLHEFLCYLLLNFTVLQAKMFINPSDFLSEFPTKNFMSSLAGPQIASTSVFSTVGTFSQIFNLDSLLGLSSPFQSLIPGLAPAFTPFHGHSNFERNRQQYNGQSRPDLGWERHIGLDDQTRYIPRTTPAPPTTSTTLSFGDYIRKATYDWLVKYKMAYFQNYFQNKSSAISDEQPDTSVTYTASEAPSNVTESQGNTTAINSSTSATYTPSTALTSPRTSTTTTTTTTTSTTLPTTTTVVTRAITIMDDYVNEIRGGFLPDQPNLGTRWTHNMDHHGHFIKS